MGLSVIDYMTGTTTAMALLAALLGAQRSGVGGDVDVSLFDVALAQLTYPAAWYLNAGHVTQRMPRSAHPSTVPSQLVRTQDGWLFVMCMTPKFWQTLAIELGHPEWLADARFAAPEHRRQHRQALGELLDQAFSARDTRSWLEQLSGKLPLSPVYDLAQALDNPYVQSVGMVQHMQHPAAADLRLVASPVKVDGERMPARTCSALGADTEALLLQAGYDVPAIAGLRRQGVI
jgi:crotonobetainyl-CoA:carnitine CoA-transferase CaiB-like acyl-CoA transferase